jgi:hypothetical protein
MDLPLTVYNGCGYPISVKACVTSNDPDRGEPPITSDFISVEPDLIKLEKNIIENPEKASFKTMVKLKCDIPHDPDTGIADSSLIASILSRGTKRHFLKLETIGGSGLSGYQVIAVTFQFTLQKLLPISGPTMREMLNSGNFSVQESDAINTVNFGDIGMDVGGVTSFVIYNMSDMKLSLESSVDEPVCT